MSHGEIPPETSASGHGASAATATACGDRESGISYSWTSCDWTPLEVVLPPLTTLDGRLGCLYQVGVTSLASWLPGPPGGSSVPPDDGGGLQNRLHCLLAARLACGVGGGAACDLLWACLAWPSFPPTYGHPSTASRQRRTGWTCPTRRDPRDPPRSRRRNSCYPPGADLAMVLPWGPAAAAVAPPGGPATAAAGPPGGLATAAALGPVLLIAGPDLARSPVDSSPGRLVPRVASGQSGWAPWIWNSSSCDRSRQGRAGPLEVGLAVPPIQ